jgi:Family of unknown function (DUF5723)
MNIRFIIYFFLFFSNFYSFSQQYLGIVGSNYAGTNSIYANPANSVGSPHKIYINLAAADLFLGNNAIKWDAPYSFVKLLSGAVNKSKKVIWRKSYLIPVENDREKNLNGLVDARGPSVLYSIDNKQSIAITSRGRGGVSFTNVSPEIAKLIQYGPRNPTIIRSAQDLNLSLNMNAFAEIGLTYGKDISINPEEAIKVGVSIKRIIGLANFHMIAKESDYQLVNNVQNPLDPTTYFNDVLYLQKVNAKYGNSDEDTGLEDFSFRPGYWAGKASPGRGFGLDLGVSYEYRPEIHKYSYKVKGVQHYDETKTKYAYKVGVSLIDIGRVRFDNPTYVSNFQTVTDNRYVFDNQMKLFPNSRLIRSVNNTLGVSETSDANSFTSNLPTTIQTYIDYKVKENVYVYGTWVQNLNGENSLGMRMPSLISVVPRYESKWIEVAMPLNLLNDYQLLTIGLSTRLGPFFIGSDNLQGLLNIGSPRGMDLYAGLNIPIYYKLPKTATDCYYDEPSSRFRNIFKKKSKKPKKSRGEI